MKVLLPGVIFKKNLENAGVEVETVPIDTTAEELITLIEGSGDIEYDCVVISGKEFASAEQAVKRLRQISSMPIVCFSKEMFSSQKKTKMLTLGADDIIFDAINNPEEFVASVVMRCSRSLSSLRKRLSFSFSGHILEISSRERAALIDNKRIALTSSEFKILYLLASNVGKVMSIKYIARIVACDLDADTGNLVQVYMCKIRKKLSRVGLDGKEVIVTSRGGGYYFGTG